MNNVRSGVEEGEELVVDGGWSAEERDAAVGAETGTYASGLFDYEGGRVDVPFVKVEFPVAVEKSGGDITHV